MEMYIEYVIFDNYIIDFLIVFFTANMLSIKFKKTNIFLSCTFGVGCAVLFPLFSINIFYLMLLKIIVSLIMVLLLKKYASFREFLSVCIVFYMFTFVFGGMCIGINQIMGLKSQGAQVLINGFSFPISIFVLFASGYLYFMLQLIRYVKQKNKVINYYFDVVIKQNGNKYYLRGYLDSGNKLLDESQPVVVIPLKTFMKVFKQYPIEKVSLGCAPNNPHYLTTMSVNGDNKMLVMDIDEISIKNSDRKKIIKDVKLGISKNNFSSDFDLLLHSTF